MTVVTLYADDIPSRIVRLTFAEVRLYDGWVWTQFPDGSGYGAYPDNSEEGRDRYLDLARRLGYETAMGYCWEHEVFHSFLAQELHGRPSPILWALAHNKRHPEYTVEEEATVQAFQGFMRARLPMTATAPDVDWWELRMLADLLLEGSEVLPKREAVR